MAVKGPTHWAETVYKPREPSRPSFRTGVSYRLRGVSTRPPATAGQAHGPRGEEVRTAAEPARQDSHRLSPVHGTRLPRQTVSRDLKPQSTQIPVTELALEINNNKEAA